MKLNDTKNGGGDEMVLEALEQIRQAEEKVSELKRLSKDEIRQYEEQKMKEIKELQTASNQKVLALATELESSQTQQLEKERALLLQEATATEKRFQEKYQKNKEQMIDYIIERVKKVYGSQ